MPLSADLKKMTGIQKAAVLLKVLGDDAKILISQLDKSLAQELKVVSSDIGNLTPDLVKEVLRDFVELLSGKDFKADKRSKIPAELFEIQGDDEQFYVLDYLYKADKKLLFENIRNEHPQVIAFLVSYISSDQAGWVLSQFPPAVQADLTFRISQMQPPNRIALRLLDRTLGEKLNLMSSSSSLEVGGIDSVVKIMRGVGRQSEKSILEVLDKSHPDLSEEIKSRMFVFEDIVLLDDRSIQKVLKEVNMKSLATALKKTSDEIADLIMRNLSDRARMVLNEEIDTMGKVPLREVDSAQQEIVETIRRMEEAGEITIQKEEEIYV